MTSIYQTLLSTGNYCLYNTGIAKRIGRNESIALGIMCTLSSAYDNSWFPCPNALLMGALSFKSKHTVLTIVDNLMALGIIEKYTDNNENWYHMDQEKLESLFDNEKMDPIELLASSSYQIYNISIADHFGDNITAVVFATLTSYSRLYADNMGWFVAPEEKIAEEICVKKRNIVREAINRLIDEKLLMTKKEGIPCKKYYRFDPDALTEFLKRLRVVEGVQKGSNLLVQLCTKGCKKVPTIYINGTFPSLHSVNVQAHFQESVEGHGQKSASEQEEKMVGLIPEEVLYEYVSAEELKMCDRLFKKAGFNHRLPREGEAPTKLLKEVIEDIRDIASGRFLEWQFDSDWSNRNLDTTKMDQCHAECHTFGDAVEAIMDTFDDYFKARDDSAYYPIDKSVLPKRFSDYLYNRHTGRSWFLQFMSMGAQTRESAAETEYLPKIPKTFKKVLSDCGLEWWDLKKIAKNVCMLSEWHRRTRGVLSRKTEYDWLVDEEDFWNSYIETLIEIIGNEHPRKGHFTVYGATHYNWMDVMTDSYGTDFNVLRKYKDEKERGYNR